ncbi:MAG: FG-GAP-like repeat-containing protein [Bacteroidota bacterium]
MQALILKRWLRLFMFSLGCFGLQQVAFGQSVILNPGFENGASPWQFYSNGSATFATDAGGAGNPVAAHIVINVQGSNVQLYQSGITLEANTQYDLSFKAYSNTGHDVAVALAKHTSPYTTYGLITQTFDLTSSWNTYSVQFTTSGFAGTVNDARFRFVLDSFDANGDQYYFDDVVLSKVGTTTSAPVIVSNPSNQTVTVGQTATFAVGASGTAPLTYQWQKNMVNIDGATSPSYTTPATVLGDSGATFGCVVTNTYGTVTSSSATLMVMVGGGGTTGTSVLANGSFESGTTSWNFYSNAGAALAIVAPGTDGSSAARVSITAGGTNVQLYQSGFALEANTAYVLKFDAHANVGRTISVSLQKHTSPYTTYGLAAQPFALGTSWQTFSVTFTTKGFTGTLTDTRLMVWLANQDAAGDQYFFDNVILAKEGEGTPTPTPPGITTQPSNQTVTVGQTATFTVGASGTAPLTYQWQKNTVNIGGATSPSYTTPATVLGDNGSAYRCIVKNSLDSAVSNAATLTVQTGPTTLSFAHHIIDSDPPRDPHDKAIGDIDGDGFIDVLAASSSNFTEGLFWYKYPSWTKYSIHTGSFSTSMAVADIDGDGDLDVIIAKGDFYGYKVYVYVNPRPSGNPEIGSLWQEVYVGDAQTHDVEIGDMNNDGKPDIVVRAGNTTIFFQNTLTTWTKAVVNTRPFEGSSLGDLDGDGDVDIAINGYWLENPLPGGNPATAPWTEHPVSPNWLDKLKVHVADVNGDGRKDILFVPSEYAGGLLAWYESTSPRTGPWTEHVIATGVGFVHTLETADMDRDGTLDVVTAEMHQSVDPDEVLVYTNNGGGLSWNKVLVATTGSHNAQLGDIGNDGRIDIVGANWDMSAPGGTPIEYWENLGGGGAVGTSLDQWTYIQADNSRGASETGKGTFGLGFADLNGDSYQDIASGHYFYRNPGGSLTATPWPRVTLPNNPVNGHSLDASLLFDAEGTGVANDIIAEDLPSVVWLKANDAQGNSWTPTVIGQIPVTLEGNGRTVKLAHIISANTKPDILLTGGDGTYLMQIPANPTGGNWPIMKITTSSNGEQKAIGIGDINRDGTLDIAVAKGALQLEVDWWSNPGDGTNTWVKHVIGTTNAEVKMIEVADINGDGRLDVIVTEEARPASLYWFEAPADPANGTWIRHTVATGLEELDSMSGIDMNNDGQPDIIVGEIFGAQRMIIYENVNNGASWNMHVVDSGKESHNGARIADLNNDGRPDIVSIAYNNYAYLHVWRNDASANAKEVPGEGSLPDKDTTPPPSKLRIPTTFTAEQNYPNPFNPATTIRFGLPYQSRVTLIVYNMLGQQVAELVNGDQDAGYHEVRFDGRNLSSGVYFYRIQAGDFTQTKRLMLVR